MKRVAFGALVFALAPVMFALGYLAHRNDWIPRGLREAVRDRMAVPQSDNVRAARPFAGDAFPLQDRNDGPDAESRAAIEAMGYAQGSRRAPALGGVTQHDADAAFSGLNLYTSGHGPEAVLIDMDGAVLHTWRCTIDDALPGYSPPAYVREAARHSWRRAYLCPDGGLLAIFEGMALIKLDRDSNVLWTYTRGCHHDLDVAPDGTVLVLTSEERGGVIDNGVAALDANGKELRHVSLGDSLRASPYAPLVEWLPARGDVLHANTVQWLDGVHAGANPAFARGNLMTSILTLNTIAAVDFDRVSVPWALTGMTKAQHDPTLLANGNIIVFDNRGAGEQSRILEIDPRTQAVVWQHPAPGGAPFYSEWCGAVQRLPNGNTLVTETDNGRAFEVTPDHRTVWEFVNPHQFD
ncbi:MAG: hypothetical protein FJY92_06230, partial [Candidatus Hydrogenedentes bacterium]|nr:hypothetical protein [Candidatus Hydrogenedentota bacterium]